MSGAAQPPRGARRWKPWELAFWCCCCPGSCRRAHSLLANEIAIFALFALSLDLILGYAGIVSLGHAAFFGTGAYAAALFAKFVMPDPLVGWWWRGVAPAAGAASSVLVMRGSDMARLMITLGVAAILYELANKLEFTGGADGLQGVTIAPLLLGRFEFDLCGPRRLRLPRWWC